MKNLKLFIIFIVSIAVFNGCSPKAENANSKTLYTSVSGKINTLDPALAADLVSQYMVASFYDTLLQYDYTARPYKLIPSMLVEMPDVSENMQDYTFTLRDDLYFQNDN